MAAVPREQSIPVTVGGPGLACRGHSGRLAHVGKGGVGVGQLFLGGARLIRTLQYQVRGGEGGRGVTWTPSKVQRAVAPLLQLPVSPSLLPQVMKNRGRVQGFVDLMASSMAITSGRIWW